MTHKDVKNHITKEYGAYPAIAIAFVDGDNMKAWNSFCGMEKVDDLMKRVTSNIEFILVEQACKAFWVRKNPRGDEFYVYFCLEGNYSDAEKELEKYAR